MPQGLSDWKRSRTANRRVSDPMSWSRPNFEPETTLVSGMFQGLQMKKRRAWRVH